MKNSVGLFKRKTAILVVILMVATSAMLLLTGCQTSDSKSEKAPGKSETTSTQQEKDEAKGESKDENKDKEEVDVEADSKETEKEPADLEEKEQEPADTESETPTPSTPESSTSTPSAPEQTPSTPSTPSTPEPATPTPESAPAHSHTWVQTSSKDATCSQPGYINEKCDCGYTKKTEILATGAHSYGDWVITTEATEQSTGLRERVCGVCGATESEVIPMLKPTVSVSWNEEVLRLVNVERANNGLSALGYAYQAQSAADVRAAEITQVFDHTRPNGTTCFTALDEAGVTYYTAGENIAMGYTTPAAVVDGWMNSPGHRANILHPNFTQLAVGINGTAWVQLFIG